jgi:hypothetical protein
MKPTDEVYETNRAVVEEQLAALVKKGIVEWSGEWRRGPDGAFEKVWRLTKFGNKGDPTTKH